MPISIKEYTTSSGKYGLVYISTNEVGTFASVTIEKMS